MDSDDEKNPAIVIDNGSSFIKSGFSGEVEPSSCFRTCVGYPKYSHGDIDFYFGKEAENNKDNLKINYPIKQGIITNYDDMEKIWGHIFTFELKVDPEEYNVLLTQQLMCPKEEKEKKAQIMFETFNVKGLCLGYTPDLSLYAAGISTGISIDLGGDSTQISAIKDGCPVPFRFDKIYYGGNEVNDYLFRLLNFNNKMLSTSKYKSCIEDIKEKSCYVAFDYDEEFKSVEPFDYQLPDNNNLILKEERIRAPEIIFKPSLIGKDDEFGLSNICNNLIEKCIDIKKDLYNRIFLSGGNSMFQGLPKRLEREIKSLALESLKEEVRVIHNSFDAKSSAFIGGAIFSNTSLLKEVSITKEMYEENGSSIIYKIKDPYSFK